MYINQYYLFDKARHNAAIKNIKLCTLFKNIRAALENSLNYSKQLASEFNTNYGMKLKDFENNCNNLKKVLAYKSSLVKYFEEMQNDFNFIREINSNKQSVKENDDLSPYKEYNKNLNRFALQSKNDMYGGLKLINPFKSPNNKEKEKPNIKQYFYLDNSIEGLRHQTETLKIKIAEVDKNESNLKIRKQALTEKTSQRLKFIRYSLILVITIVLFLIAFRIIIKFV
jgi:hypothetical protein